jgi:hypothetical protein
MLAPFLKISIPAAQSAFHTMVLETLVAQRCDTIVHHLMPCFLDSSPLHSDRFYRFP